MPLERQLISHLISNGYLDALELSDKQAVRGWLKGYANAVLLVRQVFMNKDEGTGLLNLVCSDLTCDGDKITALYKKRRKVEEFHKSLKSNAALARLPMRRVTTQNNPVFMAIYAVFKGTSKNLQFQRYLHNSLSLLS